MTRFYVRDADHPNVITASGHCSRCHAEFRWGLLEPFVLPNQHIRMLCPSCRLEHQSRQCEED